MNDDGAPAKKRKREAIQSDSIESVHQVPVSGPFRSSIERLEPNVLNQLKLPPQTEASGAYSGATVTDNVATSARTLTLANSTHNTIHGDNSVSTRNMNRNTNSSIDVDCCTYSPTEHDDGSDDTDGNDDHDGKDKRRKKKKKKEKKKETNGVQMNRHKTIRKGNNNCDSSLSDSKASEVIHAFLAGRIAEDDRTFLLADLPQFVKEHQQDLKFPEKVQCN